MICQDCKDGGAWNYDALTRLNKGQKAIAEGLFRHADELHELCHGCDCQHTTRIQTVRA